MSIATVLPLHETGGLPPVPVRRFSVDEYQRMARYGILSKDDRVELLEGWIVPKMTTNPPHDALVQIIGRVLRKHVPADWTDRVQSTVVLGTSAPEPDIAIVRGNDRDYLSRHPEAEDIGLLVEIAESSVSIDQGIKARIYAHAGILCYWIVNLTDHKLEVFTDPTGPVPAPTYRSRSVLGPDDEASFILDNHEVTRIDVAEILP